MPTLFSKIIAGEKPSTIVYEDGDVVAFQDVNPQAPVHVLIVPRREIPTINDLQPSDAELIGKMVLAAKTIAAQMNIAERGYRLVFNCNADGGQTVNHVHLHLLGGRAMAWPPG